MLAVGYLQGNTELKGVCNAYGMVLPLKQAAPQSILGLRLTA